MNEPVKGVLAIIAATIIWGLAPLYYKLLEHIPPFELLSHRTFWSFVLVVCFFLCGFTFQPSAWRVAGSNV